MGLKHHHPRHSRSPRKPLLAAAFVLSLCHAHARPKVAAYVPNWIVLDEDFGGVMIWSLDNDVKGDKSLLLALDEVLNPKPAAASR